MDRTGDTGRIEKSANLKRTVEIRIIRSDLSSSGCESVYTVDYREGMTLHNALDLIYRELDPTIAFRPYDISRSRSQGAGGAGQESAGSKGSRYHSIRRERYGNHGYNIRIRCGNRH